jgi:hypothetical protein
MRLLKAHIPASWAEVSVLFFNELGVSGGAKTISRLCVPRS